MLVQRKRTIVVEESQVDALRINGEPLLHVLTEQHGRSMAHALSAGADANLRSSDLKSPLDVAVANDRHQCASLLVSHGANPRLKREGGWTVLHDVARTNNVTMARILNKARGRVWNVVSDTDMTPAHVAAASGSLDVLKFLASLGYVDLDRQSVDCVSPLYLAAERGHVSCAKYLVDKKSKVDVTCCNGATPLYVSVQMRNEALVDLFARRTKKINEFHTTGYAPLHLACSLGLVEIAQSLLRNGADINLPANVGDGATPLHIAIRNKFPKLVAFLVESGASTSIQLDGSISVLANAVLTKTTECFRVLVEHENMNENRHFGWPLLMMMVRYQLYDMIRIAFAHNVDVDATNDDEKTALHLAAEIGDLIAVRMLLGQRAAVDARDEMHVTPLILAARMDQAETVEVLLQYGADVNARTLQNETALHAAIDNNALNAVDVLLQNKADVNLRSRSGFSALTFAVFNDHPQLISKLVAHGGDISILTPTQSSLFLIAVCNNHVECLKELFEVDEKNAYRCALQTANAENQDGQTPIFASVQLRHIECTRVLLRFNVDADVYSKKHPCTPLYAAAQNNCFDLVRLLCPASNIDFGSEKMAPALFIAAQNNNVDIVELLLENGADATVVYGDDVTALHIAAFNGAADTLKCLLPYIPIDAKKDDGSTPLVAACLRDNLEIAQILLMNGATVDMCGKGRQNALYIAAVRGNVEMIRLLCRYGANVSHRTDRGRTALHNAVGYGKEDATHALCQLGCDIDALDKTGMAAVHIAIAGRRVRCLDVLHRFGADLNTLQPDGVHPVSMAVLMDDPELVEHLVSLGSNVDAQLSESGITPLFMACQTDRYKCAEALIRCGANMEVEVTDSTPLMTALTREHVDTVKVLLEFNVDVRHAVNNLTPLVVAKTTFNEKLIKMLKNKF